MHTKNPYYLTFNDIIGKSQAMENTKLKSKKVMNSKSPILLTGPSGTGKELFARVMHFESIRAEESFVPINCAAIPDNLLESILFGYEDGAFTGSRKGGMKGQFELAHNGTIFLDEISDMSYSLQSKLLRVLQTKHFQRLGGTEFIKSDFRLISATNSELHKLVLEKKFREDLLYRINVIPIAIPSILDRMDDVPLFLDYFLEKYNTSNKTNIIGYSDDAMNILISYSWNGNVREIENTVEYSCNLCDGTLIKKEDLPIRFTTKHRSFKKGEEDIENLDRSITKISDLEKNEIIKALKINGKTSIGMQKSAIALGISLSTLYRKVNLFEL